MCRVSPVSLSSSLSSQPVEPPATEVSLQTAAHYNQPTQPPPLNEPITQGLPIKEPSFQAPPLNELSSQGPPPSQPSPPSLHANEELLSEDSDEVEMETAAPAPGLASSTLPSSTLPLPPAPANVGSRSDSGKPVYMYGVELQPVAVLTVSTPSLQPLPTLTTHPLPASWQERRMTLAPSWRKGSTFPHPPLPCPPSHRYTIMYR